MNGNRIPSIILWPTVPLAIGAAVFLTEYRPHWGLSLDAIFLSAGVLLLVRAAFIRLAVSLARSPPTHSFPWARQASSLQHCHSPLGSCL